MSGFVKALASFFYIGYLPLAPGTWGSLAGLASAWWFYPVLAPLTLILSVIGFCLCRPAEDAFQTKDPARFVLDEVCGMMLSVLWLPRSPRIFIAAFVLFRIVDTLKPCPICLIQKSKSPLSIMWDDLAAAVLVNLFLQAGVRFLGI